MKRPTECKWCGCGVVHSSSDLHVKFTCLSGWIKGDLWACGVKCSDNMSDRIRRALDKIKSSKRWSVEKITKTPIEYYPDPDGWIAQASDMDEVARILEGDADEQ